MLALPTVPSLVLLPHVSRCLSLSLSSLLACTAYRAGDVGPLPLHAARRHVSWSGVVGVRQGSRWHELALLFKFNG